jgi:hypothetical protein
MGSYSLQFCYQLTELLPGFWAPSSQHRPMGITSSLVAVMMGPPAGSYAQKVGSTPLHGQLGRWAREILRGNIATDVSRCLQQVALDFHASRLHQFRQMLHDAWNATNCPQHH